MSNTTMHYVYKYHDRLPVPPYYLDAKAYAMKAECNCKKFTEDHYLLLTDKDKP